jgi:predicted nucleic acid-binding Zn finger protein
MDFPEKSSKLYFKEQFSNYIFEASQDNLFSIGILYDQKYIVLEKWSTNKLNNYLLEDPITINQNQPLRKISTLNVNWEQDLVVVGTESGLIVGFNFKSQFKIFSIKEENSINCIQISHNLVYFSGQFGSVSAYQVEYKERYELKKNWLGAKISSLEIIQTKKGDAQVVISFDGSTPLIL